MIKRGKIVLVPFPFTDLSDSKVRPALVVSRNLSGEDIVVLFISSKPERRKSPYDILVKPTRGNGLKTKSSIKCAKMATLDKKIILGEIGSLSKSDQMKVDQKLRKIIL
jgi:mRNA interferase MazF